MDRCCRGSDDELHRTTVCQHLPVDGTSYDHVFDELGLPCRRATFRVEGAVESSFTEESTNDVDDACRVPAGVFFEIVNLVALELHMKNLSYSARLAKGEKAEKLSLRPCPPCRRMRLDYGRRAKNFQVGSEGLPCTTSSLEELVGALRTGHRYKNSRAWIEESRCESSPASLTLTKKPPIMLYSWRTPKKSWKRAIFGRVAACVEHKDRFRELHTLHEGRAFTTAPIDGKRLVNMCALWEQEGPSQPPPSGFYNKKFARRQKKAGNTKM